MKTAKRIFLIILCVFSLLCAHGCSEPPPADEGEVLAAAERLITDAVEVNRIFFWEGLPHTGRTSSGGFYGEETDETVQTPDLGEAVYYVLTEEYRYLSYGDLIAKAEAVYTKDYAEDIYEIAFEGVVSGNEDVDVLYARYVSEMGEMKINSYIIEHCLPESIPDVTTLEAVTLKHNSAVVSLKFTCEGQETVRQVTLKLEENGWRLDTPTY